MRAFRRLFLFVSVVVTASLTPAFTPAAVAGKDSATSANVVRKPTVAARDVLVVFIPGTNLSPADSTGFLDYAASQGFHAIGVAYKNSKSVAKICKKDGDACFGQVRREIVFGTDTSKRVDVTPAASIVGRLKAELVNLAATRPVAEEWSQFLPGGELNLTKIFATGHSQGAGHAAILGIDESMYRVGLFAGPNDVVRQTGKVPSWTSGQRTTPNSVWRAVSHENDNSIEDQTASWTNFNIASASRQVLSGSSGDAHLSVVVDDYLLSGVATRWKALLGIV